MSQSDYPWTMVLTVQRTLDRNDRRKTAENRDLSLLS